eukprot:2489037-Pleurochrysis_carterae.AAC.2
MATTYTRSPAASASATNPDGSWGGPRRRLLPLTPKLECEPLLREAPCAPQQVAHLRAGARRRLQRLGRQVAVVHRDDSARGHAERLRRCGRQGEAPEQLGGGHGAAPASSPQPPQRPRARPPARSS